MKSRILVIGSANIDFVCRMPIVPSAGNTVISQDSYAFVPGGNGANSALTVARLGGDVVFCARVGNDSYGTQLCEKYKSEGIDTRFVAKDKGEKTGLACVMVEDAGKNATVVYPGANKNLSLKDIENAFTCYPDAVVVTCELDEELVLNVSRMAHKKGIKLFVDADCVKQGFSLQQLEKCEVFMANETETFVLTGVIPNSSESCLRACVNIMNTIECKYVVLKLGERGCFVYDGTHCRHIAPVDIQNVVDTTGAGDAFTASLVYKYIETGSNILEAAEFANTVGALVVTKPGAFYSIPTRKELITFVEARQQAE